MTVFVSGGAKNGKSGFAQRLAVKLAAGGPLYYAATMRPSDGEDLARIARHVADRAGLGFETLECPCRILSCIDRADPAGTFLLDSVTALLMNELFPDPARPDMDPGAPARCARELTEFVGRVKNAVVVSDYIYSDAADYDEVTETFRRGLAQIDRALAAACGTVVEIASGVPVIHKGRLPE